jgi:hypothetical protein
MTWFKKHFPTLHHAPSLMARRVPLWTHVPVIAAFLLLAGSCVYNVNELANLRHAVVQKEQLEVMTAPHGITTEPSLVNGDTVCHGRITMKLETFIKGYDVCDPTIASQHGDEQMYDMNGWCANPWNRWYYGGAGCPEQK